jgi:hypothetical protein
MANDEDDELKEFGLDGAERVEGKVDAPFLAADRGIKIDGQRIGTVDLSPDALRQMSKIVNFGIAAGLSDEKILQPEHAREFLTAEEIEEHARRPPRPANATWSVSVKSKTVL